MHKSSKLRGVVSRRRLLLGVAATPAVIGAGVAYEAYQQHNVRLSEAPPHQPGRLIVPVRESELSPRLDIPLSIISDAANRALPPVTTFSGNGPGVGGKILGRKVEAGTSYSGKLVLTSPLKLTTSADAILASVTFAVTGEGGFRGDVAKILKLQKKSFRASGTVGVRISIGIGADWSPELTIVPVLEWADSPKVEIVSRAWIDVRNYVDSPLRKQLNAMADRIRASIPSDIIRRQVQEAWRVYTVPVGGVSSMQMWAHLVPMEMGASNLTFTDKEARFSVMMKVRTELSSEATTTTALPPMPALRRVPVTPGNLNFALPVRAEYGALSNAVMAEIGNRDLSVEVSGHKGAFVITDAEVYAAGEKVAIGLTFDARLPGRLFDAKGKLFLTGRPTIGNSGTLMRLVDVEFARQLDNPLWTTASILLEERIRNAIEANARVDLAPEINRLRASLEVGLSELAKTQKLKVTIRSLKAGVETIVPEANWLAALIYVEVGTDLEVMALPSVKPGGAT